MDNVEVKIIDGKLHLIVDTSVPMRAPKEGKKMHILASSKGFQTLLLPSGDALKVSLNVGK